MPVAPRADLAGLPDYVAGRKISGAYILASNEVAYPPPAAVVTAISECAADVNRYPDAGTSALRSRIAAAHRVP
jgi:histidinol-phosphate aminotransferase